MSRDDTQTQHVGLGLKQLWYVYFIIVRIEWKDPCRAGQWKVAAWSNSMRLATVIRVFDIKVKMFILRTILFSHFVKSISQVVRFKKFIVGSYRTY